MREIFTLNQDTIITDTRIVDQLQHYLIAAYHCTPRASTGL